MGSTSRLEAIVLEGESRNTYENALYTSDRLKANGWDWVLLVTAQLGRALGCDGGTEEGCRRMRCSKRRLISARAFPTRCWSSLPSSQSEVSQQQSCWKIPSQVLDANFKALPRKQRVRWIAETALPSSDYLLWKYQTKRRWLLPYLYVHRACAGMLKQFQRPRGLRRPRG